jgi:hypothetical protein
MSTTHEDKSSDKPRQRGRKAGRRGQKAGSQPNPKPEQPDGDQIDSVIASADVPASATAGPVEQSPIGEVEPAVVVAIEEVAAAGAAPTEATASAGETAPVNMQTIANAYRDYTRKSVEENRRFVGKLMDVRSLDKAVEVQTDFATRAYANFVAESQRICGLYGQLATQAFRPRKAHA